MDQSFGSFPSSETSDRLGSTGVNRSVCCSGTRDKQGGVLGGYCADDSSKNPRRWSVLSATFDDGKLQIYLMENRF